MSPRHEPMKTFKAIYKSSSQAEFELDLLAVSIAKATLAANELIPRDAVLIRVFFNPDW